LNIGIPILAGLAGAVAGWLVLKLVDWGTGFGHDPLPLRGCPPFQGGQKSPPWKGGEPPKAAGGQSRTPIPGAGFLTAALAVKFGLSIVFLVYAALILVLLGVTLFDLRKHQIPHAVTLPGIVAGLLFGTLVLPMGFAGSVGGLLVGGGVLLAATIFEAIRKKEIGGGDWKYAAMIGSFIGPQKMIVALVLTGVFGAIGAIAFAMSGSGNRPQALGPWLSAGAAASIFIW